MKLHETIKKEKALLVMVQTYKERWPSSVLAEEFKNLVTSAGIEVVDLVIAKRADITPSLYIGKGKAEELSCIVQEKNVNVVIFNNNLNFTQQRNLEEVLGAKTIDRTQLILDIFAHHAHTKEGGLQVELAQLEYLLPRLKGKGIMLSRLGGGIGTRGPGEKKLEIDRRRISDRITRLKKELENVRRQRDTSRKKRQKQNVNICSLVGYTNAGKSTLFNTLSQDSEKTSSALFTTLDTVSRMFDLTSKVKAVITDTVGFIYKLPPHLVESFKATLEELQFADVVLHVVDASSVDIERLMEAVNSILVELKVSSKPTILVFNKIDKISPQDIENLQQKYPDAVLVSALQKTNIEALKEHIYKALTKDIVEVIVKVPFDKMEVVQKIHNNCEVLKTTYSEDEASYWVRINRKNLAIFEKYNLQVKEL